MEGEREFRKEGRRAVKHHRDQSDTSTPPFPPLHPSSLCPLLPFLVSSDQKHLGDPPHRHGTVLPILKNLFDVLWARGPTPDPSEEVPETGKEEDDTRTDGAYAAPGEKLFGDRNGNHLYERLKGKGGERKGWVNGWRNGRWGGWKQGRVWRWTKAPS